MENKMEQAAGLLGLKLGDEFFVRFPDGEYAKAKLSKKGAWEVIHGVWSQSDKLLRELLTGKVEIING